MVPKGDDPSHFSRMVAGERGLLTHNMSTVLVQQAEVRAWDATTSKDLLPSCWAQVTGSVAELHNKLEPGNLPATYQAAKEKLHTEEMERRRLLEQQREAELAVHPYLIGTGRTAGEHLSAPVTWLSHGCQQRTWMLGAGRWSQLRLASRSKLANPCQSMPCICSPAYSGCTKLMPRQHSSS